MINIVVALQCEAKPIIKHYRLNGRQSDGFRIYEREKLKLIISGVGKSAAAAATSYLQALTPNIRHAWLNIGIAGHPELNLGEAILAKKITDQATSQSWYPPLIFDAPCLRADLVTFDAPANQYAGVCAHDMEASGFYATASRFNSAESVQVLKVISDNKDHPAENISAAHAEGIIASNIDTVDKLIEQLTTTSAQLTHQTAPPEIASQFIEQWHFTATQQHQLTRLLQRWHALQPEKSINEQDLSSVRNSKDFLKRLESLLQNLPIVFD